MTYNNGDKYEGEWINDKKEGKGIYYYNIGEQYGGEWKNDEIRSNNYIICEYDIKKDKLNQSIQILNSYEEAKRKNTKWDWNKIISNKIK